MGMVVEEVGQPVVDVIGKVELRKFMEKLRVTDGVLITVVSYTEQNEYRKDLNILTRKY